MLRKTFHFELQTKCWCLINFFYRKFKFCPNHHFSIVIRPIQMNAKIVLCLLFNIKYINYFLKTLPSLYMMFFSQFPHVFSKTTHFKIARREFLTRIYLYLLRNEKIAKCNSFEPEFRHEEVADIKGESVLFTFKLFNNFLLFASSIIKTKTKNT